VKLPTPIGLLQETGVIGEILRRLPRGVLDESENKNQPWFWLAKWVDRNPVEHLYRGKMEDGRAECAKLESEGFKRTDIGVYSASVTAQRKTKIREVRFYSDEHDPSKVFMRVVARWPGSFRKTFEAAASQRTAFLRLATAARGGGSISGTWHLKMRAAQIKGDQKMTDHWANKETASILQTERGRRWLLEGKTPGAPPKIQAEAQRRYRKLYAADVRRLGRTKADEKWKSTETPRFKLRSNGDYIAVAMTMEWLVGGHNGFPGLCFMSDEVLAMLLGHALPVPALYEKSSGWKTVRTIRERIGLRKAGILFTGIEKIGDNKWAILNRYGKKTHWISLTVNKPLPPEL
jgi:hypothetical protein